MKVKKNKEKGITLIALIVTIIVLLILAGVTFLAITGQNSIIKRSNRSAIDTEREGLREEMQVEIMGDYDENGFDIDKFQEKIEKDYGVKVKEEDKWEDGFRVDIEGQYGDYTVVVEKDENGKPKITVEEKEKDENGNTKRKKPGDLSVSNTQIEFDPSDWTNKGVKVTIKLDKSVDKGVSTLQYSIEGTDEWNTYRKPFEITDNNTVIVARLWNGEEEGATTTGTITRIDKLAPEIMSIEALGHTTSTITIKANAKDAAETPTDGESLISKYYFMNEEEGKWVPAGGSDNPEYTFEKLKQGKEYAFRVKVVDNAGNETEIRPEEEDKKIKVSTGKLQDLISGEGEATSNTKIEFNPTDWVPDKVTVTISTNVEIGEGARLQYSINEGATWNDYNDTPFEVTENETVIIARLYDGTNESGYATGTVKKIDKVKPYDVKMKVIGDKKTSKIQVEVSAKDDLSGIKRYKFYYKIEGGSYIEAGTQEVTQQNNSTTTYTYENLTHGKNYTLKVEAYDYVWNKNEESAEQDGKEVTARGETKEMPTVNNSNLEISFTPSTWAPSTTVTITPKNNLDVDDSEIRYKIGDEDWTRYNSTPFAVTKNTAIVAELWDGTNESTTSTGTITKIDKVVPSAVTITENTKDTNSITVNYSGADGGETTESGKSGIKKFIFYYSTNNGSSYTKHTNGEVTLSTSNTGTYSNTFKYTGLSAGTTYRLKVEAYDEAGNMTYQETPSGGITLGTPPTMQSISASRDWTSSAGHSITLTVNATDKEGGTINYTVKYGTSSGSLSSTATGTGTAGNNATVKVTGLSEATRYYFKVTATDSTGLTNTSSYKETNYKTYCIGTYCSGGWYNTRTCTTCSGRGYRYGTSSSKCTASGCVGGK